MIFLFFSYNLNELLTVLLDWGGGVVVRVESDGIYFIIIAEGKKLGIGNS